MFESSINIDVSSIFKDGDILKDSYSNQEVVVKNGKVDFISKFSIVLL